MPKLRESLAEAGEQLRKGEEPGAMMGMAKAREAKVKLRKMLHFAARVGGDPDKLRAILEALPKEELNAPDEVGAFDTNV